MVEHGQISFRICTNLQIINWDSGFDRNEPYFSVVRENGKKEELISRTGSARSRKWEEITLAFHTRPGETFQIEFGFTCGGYKGDIAIDDIIIEGMDHWSNNLTKKKQEIIKNPI